VYTYKKASIIDIFFSEIKWKMCTIYVTYLQTSVKALDDSELELAVAGGGAEGVPSPHQQHSQQRGNQDSAPLPHSRRLKCVK
jgi:hypothetical protein